MNKIDEYGVILLSVISKIYVMKKTYSLILMISITWLFLACNSNPNSQTSKEEVSKDPLPSWNETSTKQAIINYVTKVTKEGSVDFIPEEDRIATFDNDGTLWAEQPVVQIEFVFYQIAKLLKQNPELAKKQPYKAVAEKDEAYLKKMGMKELITLISAAQANRTSAEFQQEAKEFFAHFKYPKRNCDLSQIRYQPQLELLKYLQENGFKVFICTGGTVDFVRVISKDFYGVEPERVIGSSNKYIYKDSAGINDLYLTAEMISLNDKQAKPANILLSIGKRPVLACGNEGGAGDVYMLRYSQGSKYPSLQLLVNHNDSAREYEYYETPDVSLSMAKEYKWTVISIKDDWKTVFSTQ